MNAAIECRNLRLVLLETRMQRGRDAKLHATVHKAFGADELVLQTQREMPVSLGGGEKLVLRILHSAAWGQAAPPILMLRVQKRPLTPTVTATPLMTVPCPASGRVSTDKIPEAR